MTRPDAPTPPPHPPTDAEYVRKLALAILGTLQNKGLLSAAEVDSILIAARRAAQPPRAASGQSQPASPQEAPAQAFREVTVQPSPPPGTLSWQVVPPPAQERAAQEAAQQKAEAAPDSSAPDLSVQGPAEDPAEQHPAGDAAPGERETPPPVIDFKLD